MNSRVASILWGCLIAMALTGCGDGDPAVSPADSTGDESLTGRLTMTGSSTMAPLVGEIAKRFETRHPEVRIDVQSGGSSQGIADAHRGMADIGMSSRALKEGETDGVETFVLAHDGVGFVVHASNPMSSITKQQATDIYTGKTTNWSALGGPDRPITVINRAEGRSELELVTQYLGIKPSDIKPTLVAGENQECVKLVAGNADAIAYLSVGTAEYESQRDTPLKLLDLDGVAASAATVKDGSFPLGRPLVLVTGEGPAGLTRSFLDYMLSKEIDDLIAGQSFVSPR